MTDKSERGKPPIITSYVFPPIPVRHYDYCAFRQGTEVSGNYGWGASKEDAIADLITIEADAEAEAEQADAYLRDGLHSEYWR
jgi:hypothetical protein